MADHADWKPPLSVEHALSRIEAIRTRTESLYQILRDWSHTADAAKQAGRKIQELQLERTRLHAWIADQTQATPPEILPKMLQRQEVEARLAAIAAELRALQMIAEDKTQSLPARREAEEAIRQLAAERAALLGRPRVAQQPATQRPKPTAPHQQRAESRSQEDAATLPNGTLDALRARLQAVREQFSLTPSTYADTRVRVAAVEKQIAEMQTLRDRKGIPQGIRTEAFRLKQALVLERAKLKGELSKYKWQKPKQADSQTPAELHVDPDDWPLAYKEELRRLARRPQSPKQDAAPSVMPAMPETPTTAPTTPPIVEKRVPWKVLGEQARSFPTLRSYLLEHEQRGVGRETTYDMGRLEYLTGLGPTKVYKGLDEFEGYLVFYFQQSRLAALECAKVGNALYVLRGSWSILARKSKAELLHLIEQQTPDVFRIRHVGNWRECLRAVIEATQHRETQTIPLSALVAEGERTRGGEAE